MGPGGDVGSCNLSPYHSQRIRNDAWGSNEGGRDPPRTYLQVPFLCPLRCGPEGCGTAALACDWPLTCPAPLRLLFCARAEIPLNERRGSGKHWSEALGLLHLILKSSEKALLVGSIRKRHRRCLTLEPILTITLQAKNSIRLPRVRTRMQAANPNCWLEKKLVQFQKAAWQFCTKSRKKVHIFQPI